MIRTLHALTLLLAAFPALSLAQISPAVVSPWVDASGLRVQIGFEQTNLTIGEPLVLVTNIENVTSVPDPIQFNSRFQLPEGNDVELYVQAPGEVEIRAQGALDPAVYSGTVIMLDPKDRIQHTLPILYERKNPTGYLFDKAGEYTVRAQLTFSSRSRNNIHQVQLAATRITVTAPTGPAAEAYAQVAKPELAKALQLGTTTDAALIAKLRSVGEKYPQTSYGREALRTAVLSEAYSESADLKQVVTKLEKYQTLYPEERGTDQVVYTILAAYNSMQNLDLARDWFYYMRDAHPTSSMMRKQHQMYKYYYEDPATAARVSPWYLTEKPWVISGAPPPKSFQPESDQQQ